MERRTTTLQSKCNTNYFMAVHLDCEPELRTELLILRGCALVCQLNNWIIYWLSSSQLFLCNFLCGFEIKWKYIYSSVYLLNVCRIKINIFEYWWECSHDMTWIRCIPYSSLQSLWFSDSVVQILPVNRVYCNSQSLFLAVLARDRSLASKNFITLVSLMTGPIEQGFPPVMWLSMFQCAPMEKKETSFRGDKKLGRFLCIY